MTDTAPTNASRHLDEKPQAQHDDEGNVRSGLEEFERAGEGRPPWMLSKVEVKLLGIAGVGFFLDGEHYLEL